MKASTVVLLLTAVLVIAPLLVESDCDSQAESGGGACEGTTASIADNPGAIALGALVGGLALFSSVRRGEDQRRKTAGERPCPRCGEAVEVGVLDCPHCEFDFRTIGSET